MVLFTGFFDVNHFSCCISVFNQCQNVLPRCCFCAFLDLVNHLESFFELQELKLEFIGRFSTRRPGSEFSYKAVSWRTISALGLYCYSLYKVVLVSSYDLPCTVYSLNYWLSTLCWAPLEFLLPSGFMLWFTFIGWLINVWCRTNPSMCNCTFGTHCAYLVVTSLGIKYHGCFLYFPILLVIRFIANYFWYRHQDGTFSSFFFFFVWVSSGVYVTMPIRHLVNICGLYHSDSS